MKKNDMLSKRIGCKTKSILFIYFANIVLVVFLVFLFIHTKTWVTYR